MVQYIELFKAAEDAPVGSDTFYYWSEIATSSTISSTGGFDEDLVEGHGTHVAGSVAGAPIPIYGDSCVRACPTGEVRTTIHRVRYLIMYCMCMLSPCPYSDATIKGIWPK